MKFKLKSQTLLVTAILALFMLSGVIGCAGSEPAAPAEVKIGVIAPLTGEKAAIGQATIEAAELAAKEVNDAGGLQVGDQKVKVVVVVEDDKDQEAAAVAAARKLINQDNVVALTGLHISRNAIPVGEIAESSQIPMVSGKSTNPKTTEGRDYVFRVAFLDPFQGQVLAGFSQNELGVSKAAVLYDEASAYNKGIAEVYKQSFEEAGGEVVAFESYVSGQEDFLDQLTAIKDSGAEVLFLPNYFHEVPDQVTQARELGITVPVIGSDSWGILQSEDLPLVEGSYFTSHFAADSDSEVSQKFVAAYEEEYGKTPVDAAAATYDAVGMILQAMSNQGKTDPASIREGIATMGGYPGVTGDIEYQGSGDPVKSAVIMKVEDGAFKFYGYAAP